MAVASEREGAHAPHYLRLLFWLKRRLMWRAYQRNTSARIGIVLAIVVFLPLALGGAFALGVAFTHLRPPLPAHLLRAVLLGIYLFWIVTPLMGYALNDSYDITRLFVYPLSMRQIFAGAVLGSLVDFPTLLLLPALIAIVYAFSSGVAAFLLALLAAGLFLFHTLALSQALVLASAGVLRSRRFRDVLMVLIPLFWTGYYLATQTLSRRAVEVDWQRFLRSPVWDAINFLPPGLAARAIAAAHEGSFALSLALLLALALVTALTVYIAGGLVRLAYEGETVAGPSRPRRNSATVAPTPAKPVASRREAASRPGLLHLPPVVAAMAEKERRYLVRDPYFKVALMNLVYMLVVGVFAFARHRGPGGGAGLGLGPIALWAGSGLLLFGQTNLLFNLFGTEGGAAPVLFGFPGSRRQMLMGKNLTLLAALSVVNAVFLLIFCAVAGNLGALGPLLVWMELALIVLIGIGNLVSIRFPYRVILRGWRTRQMGASQGCGFGFLYLAVTAAAAVILLPVLAALALPTLFFGAGWLAVTIPVAIAYAAGLYVLSLWLAEPMLLAREIEILERVTRTDD